VSKLHFVVGGEPLGKGRPRSAIMHKRDGSAFIRVYTPKETEAYEDHIRTLAKVAANQARWAPSASARFRVLVTIYRTHEGRGPDADNVLKLALDAMNKIAFPDDRYVRELAAVVRQDKANPRLVVTVEEIAAA